MEIGRKMLLQCLARNSENATQASRNSCSHGFLHSHIPLIGIVGRRSPCSYFIMTNSTKNMCMIYEMLGEDHITHILSQQIQLKICK